MNWNRRDFPPQLSPASAVSSRRVFSTTDFVCGPACFSKALDPACTRYAQEGKITIYYNMLFGTDTRTPTEYFTISEHRHPSIRVSKQDKTRGSPDSEAQNFLKTEHGRTDCFGSQHSPPVRYHFVAGCQSD